MKISPIALAVGNMIYGMVALIINVAPNKKYLNYGFIEQMKDMMPHFALSVLMAIIVFLVGMIKINKYLLLVIQIVVGAGFYLIASIVLKLETYQYFINLLKKLLIKNKNKEK